ncbi:MAG TPA: ADP-ribose-binding protein [Phycisphaerae bacterium]|nr:ADP-ribose-binding protein [Phycisphaerae bacterium]
MQEKVCNLWIESAEFRCIPSGGALNDGGEAILIAGVAKEAGKRFDGLTLDLGRLIASRGNHCHVIRPGLISFPIQQYEWAGPSLQVIQRSAGELVGLVGDAKTLLPRPGCGQGELAWEEVSKVLSSLPDNIWVIQHT